MSGSYLPRVLAESKFPAASLDKSALNAAEMTHHMSACERGHARLLQHHSRARFFVCVPVHCVFVWQVKQKEMNCARAPENCLINIFISSFHMAAVNKAVSAPQRNAGQS